MWAARSGPPDMERARAGVPPAMGGGAVLALQRQAGNGAVARMLVQRAACGTCADKGEAPDPEQHKVDPNDRSVVPTIRCDGSGGFYTDLGIYSLDNRCGLDQAVQAHENVHKKDWETHRPRSCTNSDGTPVEAAARPIKPELGDDDFGAYTTFVSQSECRAYRADWDKALSLRQQHVYVNSSCVIPTDDYLDQIDGTYKGMGRARHSCEDALPARPKRKAPPKAD